jgi:hypothetical protein
LNDPDIAVQRQTLAQVRTLRVQINQGDLFAVSSQL